MEIQLQQGSHSIQSVTTTGGVSLLGNNYAATNGNINLNFHSASSGEGARTERRTPCSLIPFERDDDFVERGKILDEIKQKHAQSPGSHIALVGLGGVGKTQLAVEYGWRTSLSSSDEKWIFWIRAANATGVEESFREIADHVKLCGRDVPQARLFQLLRVWLSNPQNGSWLMILDNFDEADSPLSPHFGAKALDENTTSALVDPIPHCAHGSVLITSRNIEVPISLRISQRNIHRIDVMSEAEATSFITKRLGNTHDKRQVERLARELGYIPLAMSQACSHISRLPLRRSINSYLEELVDQHSAAGDLDTSEDLDTHESHSPILDTLHISFRQVQKLRSSAACLLYMMSFCDGQSIPDSLFKAFEPKRTATQQEYMVNFIGNVAQYNPSSKEFDEDLEVIVGLSLVTIIKDGSAFTMHRIVQATTRAWLVQQKCLDHYYGKFLRRLLVSLPPDAVKDLRRCSVLFSLTEMVASRKPKVQDDLLVWTEILQLRAEYAWLTRDFGTACKLESEVVAVRSLLLGNDHVHTLKSMVWLCTIHESDGRSKEAESLCQQIIESAMLHRRSGIVPNRIESCWYDALHVLTRIQCARGNFKDAKVSWEQMLEMVREKYGRESRYAAMIMVELARLLLRQHQPHEAEVLADESLKIMQKFKITGGSTTYEVKDLLARAYAMQGRLGDEEAIRVQNLEDAKLRLGKESYWTASAMEQLSETFYNQGRYSEAAKLQREALEDSYRVFQRHGSHDVYLMKLYVKTLRAQGNRKEAICWNERVLVACTEVLGSDHPSCDAVRTELLTWSKESDIANHQMLKSMLSLVIAAALCVAAWIITLYVD